MSLEQDPTDNLIDVYEDRRASLIRLANRYALDSAIGPEDVVQDAFSNMVAKLDSFEERGDTETTMNNLVTVTTRNRAIDVSRRGKRYRFETGETFDLVTETTTQPDDESVHDKTRIDNDEFFETIFAVVPPEKHGWLLMVVDADVHGKTYEQISVDRNVKINTVRSRLHRGRKLLRESLLNAGLYDDKGRPLED